MFFLKIFAFAVFCALFAAGCTSSGTGEGIVYAPPRADAATLAKRSGELAAALAPCEVRGLAFYHYTQGNIKASHAAMQRTMDIALRYGFRRPIYSGTPEELAALLHRSGLPLYGAALREDTVDARQADYTRCVLAIGSEGRGLSREVLDLCDQTIRIPMSDRCESLNAAIAAAVLLWESWR